MGAMGGAAASTAAAAAAGGTAAGSEQAEGLDGSAAEVEPVTQDKLAWDTPQQQAAQADPRQQQQQQQPPGQAPSAAAAAQTEPVTILGVEHFSRPAADYYSITALLDFASFIYLALFYQVLPLCVWRGGWGWGGEAQCGARLAGIAKHTPHTHPASQHKRRALSTQECYFGSM